jgi:DNA-binding transcriptional regulator YdaS (Cro superfamily)
MKPLKQFRGKEKRMFKDVDLRLCIVGSPFRTQAKFALESGISEPILSKYCRGLKEPSPKHAEIIERLLVEPKKPE